VRQGKRERGDLEHQILAVLGAAAEPMTAADVRETLDPTLAYNTVLTVISRLFDKGEVTRQAVGRAYAYEAADRPSVTAWRMRRLLDGDDDRTAVLTRFHDSLSPEDAALLATLLAGDDRQDAS
jgi:predicted transcriptional regulator